MSGLDYPFGGDAPAPGDLMEVAPGVRWWRVPMWGPLRHVNGYVLDRTAANGGGVTVVDTGINSDDSVAAWKVVIDGPLAATPIRQVLVTHMHPDHVGLAGWLCRHHDAPLLMTRAEWLYVRMLVADRRDEVPPEMIAFWRAAGWDDAQVATASTRGWGNFARIVSRLPLGFVRLVDGERPASVGDGNWQVVTGSGHSPEHACLVDLDRRVLVAGDQVLPRISSNVSLTVSEPDGDPLGDWLASIDKLRKLPDDLLVLPGHGEPFLGLHARLDALAAEHHERLDVLVDQLGEPMRAVDCFRFLFRRPVDDSMIGMATGEALAHLRRLELAGRATREVRDGVWWFRGA